MPFSLQNCCTDLPLRSCSAICSRQYALRSSTVLPVLLLVMSPICDRRAGFGRGVHEPLTTFRVLYRFFVIDHGRRRLLHFNPTPHPSADWVMQQLRETLAQAAPYRYAILDRDSIFNADVIAFLNATGLEPKRTSIQAPWQNGIA